MSRQQRLAKKASKILLELYKSGVNQLDVSVDNSDAHLIVFMSQVPIVTAVPREQ